MSFDSLSRINHFVRTHELTNSVRVAAVIEAGKIVPVWFERLDDHIHDRIRIAEVCYRWSHYEGSVRILNFAVTDGANSLRLSLNTASFAWSLGIAQ